MSPDGRATPAAGVEEVEASLYEVRRQIYPRAVTGWFAWWRVALVVLTQLVFYGTPWLTWNDRQAVLFDLVSRKFYIFGMVLWPQDFIFLTVLLIISAYSLFLFTAIAGRLWCGYACPQTVYTEIFMWIERRIEGDRVQRMRLDQGPASFHCARAVDRIHLRRLFHADYHACGLLRRVDAGALGDFLDIFLRLCHLRQCRLDARAGVQVHVSLCALPERDVRSGHAGHHL